MTSLMKSALFHWLHCQFGMSRATQAAPKRAEARLISIMHVRQFISGLLTPGARYLCACQS